MKRTTVYLPEELKASLERVAREQNRSEADVLRFALREHTARERPRPRPLFQSGDPGLAARVDDVLAGFGRD